MDFLGIESVEWLGYLAMAMVLLSFLMKSILYLRLINATGALLFSVYGFLLVPISKPVILTNLAILAIHVFFIFKLRRSKIDK